MAVVKANAYGHGAVPVAKAALAGGATWCGVARMSEAEELVKAGLTCPVLLLSPIPMGRIPDALSMDLAFSFWSPEVLQAAASAGRSQGKKARLHLKVDTGMGRLGVLPGHALSLARRAQEDPHVELEGVFTHFARADEPEVPTTSKQLSTFQHILTSLQDAGIQPPLVHAANSAATLTVEDAHFDLVRVGICIYGMHPSKAVSLTPAFQPALSWKTQLSQIKILPAGHGVSYGHRYVTEMEERIGVVPLGYADGFRRTAGNKVLVGGKVLPVVGRVCMDMCMVRLEGVPQTRVGDEVVLIGEQEGGRITAEEVAETWGTINYEVTCGIGPRVPRLYRNAPS